MALVPSVVDAVDAATVKGEHRPCVLAAGGIADGRGLAAALMLGADDVLCGTAFYATEESLAVRQAKRILVVACDGGAYLVPYAEGKDYSEEDYFFLKTVIPSRKATRDYLPQTEQGDDHANSH